MLEKLDAKENKIHARIHKRKDIRAREEQERIEFAEERVPKENIQERGEHLVERYAQ